MVKSNESSLQLLRVLTRNPDDQVLRNATLDSLQEGGLSVGEAEESILDHEISHLVDLSLDDLRELPEGCEFHSHCVSPGKVGAHYDRMRTIISCHRPDGTRISLWFTGRGRTPAYQLETWIEDRKGWSTAEGGEVGRAERIAVRLNEILKTIRS